MLRDFLQRIIALERRISTRWMQAGVEGAPYAEAAGVGTGGTPTIVFPAGRFTVPPIVTISFNSYVPNAQILATAITATQFQAVVYNIASGSTLTGASFAWRAVQMRSGSAAG